MTVNKLRSALDQAGITGGHAHPAPSYPITHSRTQPIQVPAALADVALIDAKTFASAASICLSELHDRVRNGSAPQPVIRQHRYTRWKMSDVRQYLLDLAAKGAADSESAERTMANARHASREAKARRAPTPPAAKA